MRTGGDKKEERRAQGRRLKAARTHFGFKTAKEAARLLRFDSEDTYAQHENGTRGMGRAVSVYAERYDVPEEWLLYGRNPPAWVLAAEHPEEERRGAAEHFLRPWRLFRHVTEDELASKLGVPADIVQGWEAGRQDISDKWLRRAAVILQTTPGALLDVDPHAVPPTLLEMWLDMASRQRQVIALADELRTGTGG